MTGTTPATAASKRSCTPCSRAVAHSSSPCWESSCLLADTTWRPARPARRAYSARGSTGGARAHRAQDVLASGLHPAHRLDDQVRGGEDLVEVAARAGQHAADL